MRRRTRQVLLEGHECQTARFAGLSGLKNGVLLERAEAAGFDALITVDQNIPNQQNLMHRRISIVILSASTSRLRDLRPLVPTVIAALASIGAGEVVRIR